MVPARKPLALGQELVEMPAPPCRVFTAALSPCLGGIEDILDPAAQPLRRLGCALPQTLKHAEHVMGADLAHRLAAHGLGIFGERHCPLRSVFGIAPRRPHRLHIGIGGFAEGRDVLVFGPLRLRIDAGRQQPPQLRRFRTGIGERQVAPSAEPQLGAFACAHIHENPAPPIFGVDEQVEAAAVRVAPRLVQLRRLRRAQLVDRSSGHPPRLLGPTSGPTLYARQDGMSRNATG